MNLPNNSKTSPVANLAPSNLARIKPCLDFNLNIFTFDGNFFCMYLVSFPLKCFLSLKSSTKIISCNIDSVVVSRTLHTVLKYNLSYIILEVNYLCMYFNRVRSLFLSSKFKLTDTILKFLGLFYKVKITLDGASKLQKRPRNFKIVFHT